MLKEIRERGNRGSWVSGFDRSSNFKARSSKHSSPSHDKENMQKVEKMRKFKVKEVDHSPQKARQDLSSQNRVLKDQIRDLERAFQSQG